MNLLLSRKYLTLCFCLGTEIGVGWESPKHVQNVEPAVCSQQPLSVHWWKQRYPVVVGPQYHMSLQTKCLGGVGEELQQLSAVGRLLWSCLYSIQQTSTKQHNKSRKKKSVILMILCKSCNIMITHFKSVPWCRGSFLVLLWALQSRCKTLGRQTNSSVVYNGCRQSM